MNIKIHDNRSFGRKPVVGIHSMKSMIKFRCEPLCIDDALENPIGMFCIATHRKKGKKGKKKRSPEKMNRKEENVRVAKTTSDPLRKSGLLSLSTVSLAPACRALAPNIQLCRDALSIIS